MKLSEIDIVYMSYDEPNAELNYADLLTKAPWAKRIHGIKGSDNAHKAAADQAETEWFITVDGDNIVYDKFFDLELEPEKTDVQVYSWSSLNVINGLRYGNGGIKVWKKDFVLNMKTHEQAEQDTSQIDFCWEKGYQNFPFVFSDTVVNTTPYQAWRAGFREGVKMLTVHGIKIEKELIFEQVYWHNLHRLGIWSSIGSHSKNGLYAILGARQGSYQMYCTDWDYIEVRDFEKLESLYQKIAKPFEGNELLCIEEINKLGKLLKMNLGLDWAYFNPEQSKYLVNFYDESIALGQTYYNKVPPWKNIF